MGCAGYERGWGDIAGVVRFEGGGVGLLVGGK